MRKMTGLVVFVAMLVSVFPAFSQAQQGGGEWNLVFEDDFDRQEVGDDWDFVQGSGRIVDGRLFIQGTRDDCAAMIVREFTPDVRLEFEAEADPKTPPCDVAVGLGGNAFTSYGYLLQFGARSNQVNQVYVPHREKKLPQVDSEPPFHIEHGKVYHCVAVKEGHRISYAVDGVRLLDMADEDVMGGPCFNNVFIVTWNGMFVDHVKVYERATPAPDGPVYLDDPRALDIGYRWQDRQLGYEGDRPLNEPVREAIEAYNRREYKKAFALLTELDPPTLHSVVAAAYVLGDLDYAERVVDQQRVAHLARQVAGPKPNDPAAAAYAMLAGWFSKVTLFSRDWQNCERVYCLGPDNNPLYYKSLLFRGRYHLAWALEQGLARQKAEALAVFAELKKTWPNHPGLAQLTGEQVLWSKELIRDESEGPAWARYLEEGLVRGNRIMDWWFTDRQAPDGQLGGGWGDDVELLPSFGMLAGISTAGTTAIDGIERLAEGVWKHALHGEGYGQGDVEHASELTAEVNPLMLLLRYGDPQYVERNLESARILYNVAMGVNERGGLQFKSCEFNAKEVNLHYSAVGQNLYHTRPMRHFVWLAWYGLPEAENVVVRFADNLRDVSMAKIGPKPAGYMPFSIFWPSGSIYPPKGRLWLDPKAHYYGMAPNKLWKYHFALCSAYSFNGDRRLLEPIDRMMDWASMAPGQLPYDESLPRDHMKNLMADLSRQNARDVSTLYHWLTGSSVYDANGISASMRYLADQNLDRFTETFEEAVKKLRYNWAAKTSEVLQTDRFGIGGDLAVFSGYTGAVTELIEDALIPTIAVTWESPNLHFAAVVRSSSAERLRVLIYSFNDKTTRIGLKPWLLVPGKYWLIDGEDEGKGFRPIHWEDEREITFKHRGTPIYVDVPSRKAWTVDLRLLETLDRPARLPDLAIHPRDVRAESGDLVVTVHNIGSAGTGAFDIVVEKPDGTRWSEVAEAHIDGLPGIKDFEPVRRDVTLPGAGRRAGDHYRVVLRRSGQIEELYELNNVAEVNR